VTHRNVSAARPLTELQQAILSFLWATGPATAEAIRAGLRARHPLKDSSVRTLLRRLEARGYVAHELAGNTFVYRAELHASRVAARAVRQIIERLCAGSVEQFLLGMVDEHVIPRHEIERVARKVRKPR
jgi:BlaI family transcriptional regulator, penicillinase repressor